MARSQLNDSLLSHEFHLIDVDIKPPFNPPFVLWPTAGFSSITAPEVDIQTEEITEGTSDYTYKVLKQASTNNVTLTKGVSMFNSDFWRWIVGALSGKREESIGLGVTGAPIAPARRRNLLLIQSSGLSVEGIMSILHHGSPLEKVKATTLIPAAGITQTVSAAVSFLSQGVADLNMLAVPGRAYMLFDCLPVRYKAAGDFDANSVGISLEELDLSYTRFELFGAWG
jgi:phage tail-like protein